MASSTLEVQEVNVEEKNINPPAIEGQDVNADIAGHEEKNTSPPVIEEQDVNTNVVVHEQKGAAETLDVVDSLAIEVTPENPNKDGIAASNSEDHSVNTEESKSRAIVCVGVPGSGKSTFSNALCKHFPDWVRVNQDDLGNRKACEEVARASLSKGKNIIIDRCNFDEAQRRTWIHIAWNFDVPVDAIIMNTSMEECASRINVRENHPTNVQGTEGIEILNKFRDWMKPPQIKEGFERVIRIPPQITNEYTEDAIRVILETLNAEVPVKHDRKKFIGNNQGRRGNSQGSRRDGNSRRGGNHQKQGNYQRGGSSNRNYQQDGNSSRDVDVDQQQQNPHTNANEQH